MSNIAVVVPTIRKETIQDFYDKWEAVFLKHDIIFVLVVDGDDPKILAGKKRLWPTEDTHIPKELASNHCAGVRNYGFAFIAEYLPEIEYIITLDDDETPIGDPIQDHIDALNRRVPISWMSTTIVKRPSDYMRGFPYAVREEAQAMLSHGVWRGVPDHDAPTQLQSPSTDIEYYKGPIPKGVFFPMCGMNLAFRRSILPYIYFAPVGQYKGAERFDDIWAGIEIKKDLDELGLAVVTGYAETNHDRKSNVFESLKREALGIQKNEGYWKGEYDEWYKDFIIKRRKWYNYIKSCKGN